MLQKLASKAEKIYSETQRRGKVTKEAMLLVRVLKGCALIIIPSSTKVTFTATLIVNQKKSRAF